MAKKQTDTEQQDSDSAIKRVTLRFDQTNDNQKIVYEYLKDLPYGSKTDAIVTAILERAARHHEVEAEKEKLHEEIRATIHQEVCSNIPNIVAAVIDGIRNEIAIMPATQQKPVVTSETKENPNDTKEPVGLTEEAALALQLAEMF